MERRRQQNRISGMQQPPDADPRIMQLQSNITALQAQIDALRKAAVKEHDEPAPVAQQVAAKEKKKSCPKIEKLRHVKTLPAVPLTNYDEVVWDPPSLGGTGDGQIWTAAGLNTSTGGNFWYPNQIWASKIGTPGT